jgi:hypothetical protein
MIVGAYSRLWMNEAVLLQKTHGEIVAENSWIICWRKLQHGGKCRRAHQPPQLILYGATKMPANKM